MPQAVAHILIPMLFVAVLRDLYLNRKNKKVFPLHYVFIAGLAGIIPDLDIAAFWVLHFFGFSFEQIHKTYAHSLLVPMAFFLLFLILIPVNKKAKICNMGKHNLKLSLIFLMLFTGSLLHLVLDGLFGEPFTILYPFSTVMIGLNIDGYLPFELQSLFPATLDAALLIIWLFYLQLKHKISDVI